MLESEFETNGLTMKLLGLSRYCEGSRAAEIRAVIDRLPVAAYNERTAAEDEIARLRRENAALKHQLSVRSITTPSSGRRHQISGSVRIGDEGDRLERPQLSHDRRFSFSPSSSAQHPPPNTPPPQDLFSGITKRPRTDSILAGRRPVCAGCFQVNGLCDSKVECAVCRARDYRCEYRECWDGITCLDLSCTRIHPDQWDPVREPTRKVNQSRNGGGNSWR